MQMQQPVYRRQVLDDRLHPPHRQHYAQGPGLPINIETRESGGEYQQIGILSKGTINNTEANPGNNTDSVILPLFGKRLYRGSNKWLYYTETDKYRPVKIPITVNGRDCTDDTGCDELSNGSTVSVPSYNGTFNVKIYQLNKPRYIPFV